MPAEPHTFRSLVLPREHGSWSLALEPVALGLLIAPSAAGGWLAAAVVGGFLARRPLKLAWTLPPLEERRGAAASWTMLLGFGAILALLAAAGLLGTGGGRPGASALWPLLLSAPFGAAFLWFDLRHEMREAEAELAGSTAFALVPAAFATLAGWNAAAALGLSVLMLGRSLPTVLTVRSYLRLHKRQPAAPAGALAAAGIALAASVALAARGFVPALAPVFAALLFVRTLFLVTPLRPDWSARRVGLLEAVLGLVCLAGWTALYRSD